MALESNLPGVVVRTLAAQRSQLKVLNHLSASIARDDVARHLGAHHAADHGWYSAVGKILAAHQSGIAATLRPGSIQWRSGDPARITKRALNLLVEEVRRVGGSLTTDELPALLRPLFDASQLEFHPSDICNEACDNCTYGHDDPRLKPPAVSFPYSEIGRVAEMHPSAIAIAGGGEPCLYKNDGKDFADLMNELRALLPKCRFGLITNGTIFPRGDWHKHFDWIRLSIDAASPSTYLEVRGRDYFVRVTEHLIRLLRESTVASIGVGFVYSSRNVAEAVPAIRYFYDLVDAACRRELPRLNIAFRPLRRDRDDGRVFPDAITPDQQRTVDRQLDALQRDVTLSSFLSVQTNCEVLSGRVSHAHSFCRCDYSMIFRLVRASGELRPCCMRLNEPEFYLGNLVHDTREAIALNVLFNAGYLKPGCDQSGCRLSGLNRLIADGMSGSIQPPSTPTIACDPFFG